MDTELVRYLAFVAFGFFIFYLVKVVREKPKSGKLKKSVGVEVHPAAKIVWMFMFFIMAISFLVPPFYPQLLYWNLLGADSRLIDALQLLGFALIVSGGLLFFWTRSALGRYMVPEIMIAEGHRLVTEGPYRWIRHPAYTSNMLIFTGLTIFYMNPLLGIFGLITAATAVYRARKEEALLMSTSAFGNEYLEYRRKTGMFLPKL